MHLMKSMTLFPLIGTILAAIACPAGAQDAPYVVSMTPKNGAVDVDPKLKEIVITFSEPMTDRSWSVTGGGENAPEVTDIHYEKNCTVLVMKVKLKPGWIYRFGLNSPSFRNFKSRKGVSLEPVQVTFRTKGKRKIASQDVQNDAPYIVSMKPENGHTDVDPKLKEIVITFSEPMTDKSWSVTGGGENYPEITSIYYKKNCTVLVMKVKLKPGWSYQFGINSPSFRNFKNRKGVPVDPVLVTFRTKGGKSSKGEKSTVKLSSMGKADFRMTDANGVRLSGKDYAGVPLFITFGAAW
jgi:hypothetical protein